MCMMRRNRDWSMCGYIRWDERRHKRRIARMVRMNRRWDKRRDNGRSASAYRVHAVSWVSLRVNLSLGMHGRNAMGRRHRVIRKRRRRSARRWYHHPIVRMIRRREERPLLHRMRWRMRMKAISRRGWWDAMRGTREYECRRRVPSPRTDTRTGHGA